MKILITSGGTKVPVDKVRFLSNMSTGTFGSKIGTEILKMGHNLVFYRAKNSKSPMSLNIDLMKGYSLGQFTDWYNSRSKHMERYQEYEYSTFDQYADGLKFIIGSEQPDVIVLAAAVSDYGVENYVDGKMRSNDLFNIKLKQLPKLINRIKEWSPKSKLVGFKLLVNSKGNELIDAATRSVNDNGCELVVANDLRDIKNNNHQINLVYKGGSVFTFKSDYEPENPNYLAQKVADAIITL